jgi:signal peptidase I
MSKLKSDKDKDPKKPAKADAKDAKPADGGWRETVESIAMAVILALLFRGFVAEAFVIPTGSMAPTLQGRHKDVWCPKCGVNYQTTASSERSQSGAANPTHVTTTTCPICRYTQRLDLFDKPNDHSFSGDRIIVGKFCYDLADPQRWDVIVFKFPGDAVQNYIKRLIGLPNETIRIVGGNIYTRGNDEPDDAFRIARKPPHKLNVLLQLVDDTDHIPQELIDLGWPSRWQEIPPTGAWQSENGGRSFVTTGQPPDDAWLRYRHLAPTHSDWVSIEQQKQLPGDVKERKGQLISDFYAYNAFHAAGEAIPAGGRPYGYLLPERNDLENYNPALPGPGEPPLPESLGQHWVDDLAVECVADVTGTQGELLLMLVRAGRKYQCRINVADGKATMSILDTDGEPLGFDGPEDAPLVNPTAQTNIKGPGSYRVRLSNCDHELLLWVNGSVVKFDAATTYPSDYLLTPVYADEDPGDLAPAGIGTSGLAVRVSGLRIFRDKYYIAGQTGHEWEDEYVNIRLPDRGVFESDGEKLQRIFADPELWATSGLFADGNRKERIIVLKEDQFLPMGDNSPQSFDGRFWRPASDPRFPDDHNFVERDLLIGKALLIYWPHTWNRPIPFTPNFRKMGPIR